MFTACEMSAAAELTSVPPVSSTVTAEAPTLLTPVNCLTEPSWLIAFSSLSVTSALIVVALAPGSSTWTITVG